MTPRLRAILLLSAAVVMACGGDDDDEDDNCADVSGSWAINGCATTGCTVAQSGCSISLTCTTVVLTTVDFTGTVAGSAVNFADDMGGSCEGTIDGTQMIGTCTSETGTCQWDADLR
jgi:hypothetical protein